MPGYGVPRHRRGLLDWGDAVKRLEAAKNYWLATANAAGEPHAVPVWGIWLDGRLYVSGGESTRWVRNLSENPRLAVHLESGDQVVAVEGEARFHEDLEAELQVRLADASEAKYGLRPPMPYPPVWVLHPRKAFAWTNLPSDATRWRFEPD
jgi:nitroimidazol reductase NimA-like FMN-containing flavoprotein (pyridoxamine 5'-phosphate oxidase superfamily)